MNKLFCQIYDKLIIQHKFILYNHFNIILINVTNIYLIRPYILYLSWQIASKLLSELDLLLKDKWVKIVLSKWIHNKLD